MTIFPNIQCSNKGRRITSFFMDNRMKMYLVFSFYLHFCISLSIFNKKKFERKKKILINVISKIFTFHKIHICLPFSLFDFFYELLKFIFIFILIISTNKSCLLIFKFDGSTLDRRWKLPSGVQHRQRNFSMEWWNAQT